MGTRSRQKARSKNRGDEFELPSRCRAPVDPGELKFCFSLGAAVLSGQMPTPNPWDKPIHLMEENGEVETLYFTDTQYARYILAISKHVKSTAAPGTDTFAKSASINFRIDAMIKLIKHPRVKQWCRGEYYELHEAFLEAAASAELQPDGKFEPNAFFDLVAKIANEKYAGQWA